MNDSSLTTPQVIGNFMAGSPEVEIKVDKPQRHAWVAKTLKRTDYFSLRKRDKSIVLEWIHKVTGYSRQHLSRLIAQYRKAHWIGSRQKLSHRFSTKYTVADKHLLAKVDELHGTLSGTTTKKLLERAYEVYKDDAYERLAKISVSHLYNLRKSSTYLHKRRHFEKTKRSKVAIGERRQPKPEGAPGYIRIDTVHQGDQDKQKGVYHINSVDEVTQFEVVCSVEKISERYLIPVLAELLARFPFEIKGFHSDNGSEYINKEVVKLLNKLHIEFTKSRARHSNDNALAECKNGAVVRKHLGYIHIPQKWAPLLNEFNLEYLTPYLNFHRPCHYPNTIIDSTGKEKKQYRYQDIMTPYEKLKSLPNAKQYLKPGITFKALDKIARQMSDMEAADKMNKAKHKVFKKIFGDETCRNAPLVHQN